MAESPAEYVTPEGTRVNITYGGVTVPGVMASDFVVTADFSEDAGEASWMGWFGEKKEKAEQ